LEYKDEANYTVSLADLKYHPRLPSEASPKKRKAGHGSKGNKSGKACKSKAVAMGEAGAPDTLSSEKPVSGLTKDKIMTKPQFVTDFDATNVPLSSLQFLSF
jgi:hypothetical protein